MRRKSDDCEPTKVVGVRADPFFWRTLEELADREGVSRNSLIVRVLIDYIMRYDDKKQ